MSLTVITILCICLTSSIGILLGSMKFKGISIGVCGVLFAGLIGGYILNKEQIVLNSEVLSFLREFGLILFIYSTGMTIGPNIFTSLKKDGILMNIMSIAVVAIGFIITVLIGKLGFANVAQAVGLYAGAVNSTPSLGAGQQILTDLKIDLSLLPQTGMMYALSYPFAIISGIFVFIIIKSIFKINIADEVALYEARKAKDNPNMQGFNVIVNNPNFNGIEIGHFLKMIHYSMAVSRMKRGSDYIVPHEHTKLQVGDILLLFGPQSIFETVSILFQVDNERDLMKESEKAIQSQSILLTKPMHVGKPLKTIMGGERRHWVISRVIRNGISHSPTPDFKLAYGDKIIAVGKSTDVLPLVRYLGNSKQAITAVRFIPFFVGMIIGIFIGLIPFKIPGIDATIKLGTAGGPLLTALLLSYRGSLGRMVFFTPSIVLSAFKDLGLILFLAVVGLSSGAYFFNLICSFLGLSMIGLGILITALPMMAVGVFMRYYKKMNYLTICGTLSGCISSLPTLTFILNMSGTDAAMLGYASVYPLTLILRILTIQVIALLLF
ncbi:MAG: putative transporter [Alphaproteobacteria bacterium]|nr:putative transporter [Alphaproteobacteria bacterium]